MTIPNYLGSHEPPGFGELSMNSTLTIRNMISQDLKPVLEIQSECYTAIEPESRKSLSSKLNASPSTCFVACDGGNVVGYLISLPWIFAAPPALNAPECEIPASPDCLYLHDLAVAPTARRAGAGQVLVNEFLLKIRELGLVRASLIAVQGSAPYWRRYGFYRVALTASLKSKLSTYGDGVEYMEYRVEGPYTD